MCSPETTRLTGIVGALALAGLTAGCFQPLYGNQASIAGAPGLTDRLSSVDVPPIDAPNGTRLSRVGLEVRNDLIYGLTGGQRAGPTNYTIVVGLTAQKPHAMIDTQ